MNMEVFEWIDLKMDENVLELNNMEKFLVANHGYFMGNLVEERTIVSEDLWSKLELKESMLHLKSCQAKLK